MCVCVCDQGRWSDFYDHENYLCVCVCVRERLSWPLTSEPYWPVCSGHHRNQRPSTSNPNSLDQWGVYTYRRTHAYKVTFCFIHCGKVAVFFAHGNWNVNLKRNRFSAFGSKGCKLLRTSELNSLDPSYSLTHTHTHTGWKASSHLHTNLPRQAVRSMGPCSVWRTHCRFGQ